MTRWRMRVEGMTCEHCERTVEGALAAAGAKDPKADFRRGEASFAYQGDEAELADTVRGAGYQPGPLERVDDHTVGGVGEPGVDFDLVIIGAGSAAFASSASGSRTSRIPGRRT